MSTNNGFSAFVGALALLAIGPVIGAQQTPERPGEQGTSPEVEQRARPQESGEVEPVEETPEEAGEEQAPGEDPAVAQPPAGASESPDEPVPAPDPGSSAGPTSPSDVEPTPPVTGRALAPYAPGYRQLGDANAMLTAFSQAKPEAAHTFELGRTGDGRSVTGIEFGALGAPALFERPTVFLLGGLDGQSLAGAEAVLSCVHHLLSDVGALPEGVCFVAVPWVAAEGLSFAREAYDGQPALDGRNARPLDDDRDGLLDEDGPDDLDGDGMVLDMLIEDPAGPWARGGDGRFLVPAQPGDGVRFIWTREGRDDDGDGRFNEDPVGGVVIDRNFPINRTGPWDDPRCGEVPMSEPLTRALAELLLSRRAAAVLIFQGHHGMLAVPGGVPAGLRSDAGPGAVGWNAGDPGSSPAPAPGEPAGQPAHERILGDPVGGQVTIAGDEPLFERVTEAFRAATGRPQAGVRTLFEARSSATHGAALDWMHAVVGALSIEVAPWGPLVESRERIALPRDASLQDRAPAPRSLDGRPLMGEVEAAWASWLDNTRGGLGFVDWQPVELDGGRQGWVGGWEPRTILNPPEDSLALSLEGLPEFVSELAASLPALEIQITRSEREGELVRLSARVNNTGRLPTGLASRSAAARNGAATGVALELELPPGAQLVAGAPRATMPRLFGGELSREVSWVLIAPEDSVFRLKARADWATAVTLEERR